MVSDLTKRHRELFAWAIVVYLLAGMLFDFMGLFVDFGFTENAALRYAGFVSPLAAGLIVLAVLLVTHVDTPTTNARPITVLALTLVAAMLLLGLVTWVVGLTAESPFGSNASRLLGSLHFLLGCGLMAAAGFFAFTVYRALPAPVRRHVPGAAPYAQQGWGQQPGPDAPGGPTTPQTAWTAATQRARLRSPDPSPSWWARTWGQEPEHAQQYPERADRGPEAGQRRDEPWHEHRGGWPRH